MKHSWQYVNSSRLFVGAAALSLCAASANAQGISVTVDGEVVSFVGQSPIEQNGSVLVPLRGVFEKLGASVAYNGATKTILAVKGATSVSLQIGSTGASVNGVAKTLTSPAQAINGTTLVPLRFVSEALGAAVKWSGPSRTVIISTNGAPSGTPAPAPAATELSATSLTYAPTQALRAGETLTVTLTGTPGGTASFTIPGIEQAKSVPMKEAEAGNYVGSLAMPAGINVKAATILGTLKKGTQAAPTLQAAQPLTVDTVGPTLSSLSPAPNASLAPGKPLIYGTMSDSGTGINEKKVHLTVNGADVTGKATITEALSPTSRMRTCR